MENHADKIVSRGLAVVFITPGFVYEYTDLTCSHGVSSFGKTKARIAPRLRQESFPLAGDSGFRPCRQILYQNQFRWRNRPGEKSRITNDPRSPAPPRRAGHLLSIWRVRHSRARHFQAMRGHPTDCRRDHSERVLRAARPPVAFHSLRNSLDMYLRGISSSERTIPTRIIV